MHPTVEELRRIRVFADQPEEQLGWLAGLTTLHEYEAGAIVTREGDPAREMAIVFEGAVQGRSDDGMDSTVYMARAGEVTGKLPHSRMVLYPLTTRTMERTKLGLIDCDHLDEFARRLPEATSRLVGVMVDRARETTFQDRHRDKMAALGRVSAGLAHELNNPATAARRAAANIRDSLATLRRAERDLASHSLSPEQYCTLSEIEEELAKRAREASALDALERSDREQIIGEFLEEKGVEEAWPLAGCLVDANFTEDHLASLTSVLGARTVGPALVRLSASVTLARLAEEINDSCTRIGDLVKAIKRYSHMDQRPDHPVDLHRSLETTLTILNHMIKDGIKVIRDYDRGLPFIEGFGGELNQVWTNLINNAVDAMNGKGELHIRTAREGEGVIVEIGDNGAGIADEIKTLIFEPFFTTKDVGEGTGLGLDEVRRIVNKHNGRITFESKPGDTRFAVWLPLTQEKCVAPATSSESRDSL